MTYIPAAVAQDAQGAEESGGGKYREALRSEDKMSYEKVRKDDGKAYHEHYELFDHLR